MTFRCLVLSGDRMSRVRRAIVAKLQIHEKGAQ
jgi:hypothetical protein